MAGFAATAFAAGAFTAGALAAGFGALFFTAWRALAGGAALARACGDDFDFIAVFFNLEAALAMIYINPRKCEEFARLTPF
ncbi:hypothetical protein [Bradyrhizobium sp.]|uniref:hypothetical protein n=1 Tax=Bradyrhizobium sp. TaxID=376 RepID=UPI0025C36539|nr:hypothetical protein [Bradyrhizobium sp.]